MQIHNVEYLKEKKVLVVCPTRNRIKLIKKWIESFQKTASKESAFIICIDDDDQDLEKYKNILRNECYVIGKRRPITQIFNDVFKALPDFQFYMLSNDDFVFQTYHWDVLLTDRIKNDGNGWGIAYGDDGLQGENMCTSPLISGNIARSLGWLQMPALHHLFGDNVWMTIGRGMNRLFYVKEAKIRHDHFLRTKEEPDEIAKVTNAKSMYEKDGQAFDRWCKEKSAVRIENVMREILKNCTKTVSLCMIVSDQENPETLKRCLESVKGCVDEICVIVNYKNFYNYLTVKNLETALKPYNYKLCHERWTDFSDMRNKSLKMATGDYILWLDCDDVMDAPWRIKDFIMRYPDADYFNCDILSYTETGTKELILHNRLFKNGKGFEFRNKVHEDISFSMIEKKAVRQKANITIHHLGNTTWKDVVRKNERNYRLILKDIETPEAHSLTYYALINCLMIIAKDRQQSHPKSDWQKYFKEAIEWIDKCFIKCPTSNTDPLTPKLWTLRGICCMCCNQTTAAKQSLHKAWDEMRHIEAGVNLAECYIREKDFKKAVTILEELYAIKEIVVTNMAMDIPDLRQLILKKLGICWSNIHVTTTVNNAGDLQRAEKFYREFLQIKPNDIFVIDALMRIFNNTGRMDEGAFLAIKLINMHPKYPNAWYNFGCYECMNKRYATAKVFFEQCLKRNPNHQEAKHNLAQITEMGIL